MRHFSLMRNGFIAAFLTAGLTLNAAAASFGTGTVNASALRLRAQPSTTSSTLAQAYRGASVEVLSDAADGWYPVSFNGKVGYMSAEYLLVTPFASEDSNAEDTAKSEEVEKAEKTDENPSTGRVSLSYSSVLNIRASADAASKRLGTVPNGTLLTLDASENGWYLVTYNGITGYVSAEYVQPVTDLTVSDSSMGSSIVNEALKYLGCSYVYGASGPKAFDCSGLTSYVFRQLGYTINRTASAQMSNGISVAYSDLQPGDLVFFRDYSCKKAASHVGIYIGDGNFIHAETSGRSVKITSLSQTWYAKRYVGARRVL